MSFLMNMWRRDSSADRTSQLLANTRRTILLATESLAVEKGSSELTMNEVADTAQMSVTTVALFFRSTDEMLVEAALDLARMEILRKYLAKRPPAAGPATSDFAQHFHRHRQFYIAMQSGSCAPALNAAFDDLFSYFNALNVTVVLGPNAAPARVRAISRAITTLAREAVRSWLLEETGNPSAESLYTLLERVMNDGISNGLPTPETQPPD